MIVYVLIGAFVAGLASGAGGMNWWNEAATARHEKALAAAQAKVDAQARQAEVEAANKIAGMQKAFDAGQEKAKIVTKIIYDKGASYVQNTPALRAPQCDIDPVGVSIIAGAVTDLQRTAAASVLGLSVSSAVYPAAGANAGVGAVPAVSGKSQPAKGVPQ